MFADLHLHSVYSDGRYAPDRICALAQERGLGLLSITDHDTLAGLEIKRAQAKAYGLQYISGWEVSAYEGETKVHILGYGCEADGAYAAFTETRKQAAFVRAEESVEKFRALGVPVTFDEVLAQRSASDLPVHTMHVARAASKYLGLAEGEVYLRYLAVGKAANSNYGRPTPKEAIDCIHASGGIASIAHPGRITLPFAEREALLLRLTSLGADGIEAFYTTHTKEDEEYFLSFAKEKSLLVTGGSDTHIEDGTHAVGAPRFSVSDDLLERLKIRKTEAPCLR